MENYEKSCDRLCGKVVVDYRLDEYGDLINLILEDGIEIHAAGAEDGLSYLEVIE